MSTTVALGLAIAAGVFIVGSGTLFIVCTAVQYKLHLRKRLAAIRNRTQAEPFPSHLLLPVIVNAAVVFPSRNAAENRIEQHSAPLTRIHSQLSVLHGRSHSVAGSNNDNNANSAANWDHENVLYTTDGGNTRGDTIEAVGRNRENGNTNSNMNQHHYYHSNGITRQGHHLQSRSSANVALYGLPIDEHNIFNPPLISPASCRINPPPGVMYQLRDASIVYGRAEYIAHQHSPTEKRECWPEQQEGQE